MKKKLSMHHPLLRRIGEIADKENVRAFVVGGKDVLTFPKFGTAMLPTADGKIEFVGARKESYSQSSRKPAVEEGTLEEDISRRDFTVNAIAAALNKESF